MSLWVGLGGAGRNACAALSADSGLLGVCEQERVTRVPAAGSNATGLPDEAIDELLRRSERRRDDVTSYVMTEMTASSGSPSLTHLDHHFAHACSAFLPSGLDSATILVCDHEAPEVSVWDGSNGTVTRVEWPWKGPGFATFYTRCAEILGFVNGGREQRMESMARLNPGHRDERASRIVTLQAERLALASDWESQIEAWLACPQFDRSFAAAALQSRIADLLVEMVETVKRRAPARRNLCLGGSLFYNSRFNAVIKQCGAFDDVFIPVNPGNAGLAVGAALHASGQAPQRVTPFLGPSFSGEEIKATLDNCKLTYQWQSDDDAVGIVVDALQRGRLVAWFEGRMEWGPRALGGRSILANPFAPYVLDNLNRYLKRRDPWRGYALSGLAPAIQKCFDGPERSDFMECDYVPKDRRCFRHVLPGENASVRIHTVGAGEPTRFQALLSAFGQASGLPILVNTSFNAFHEPIVCSPRDAIRVFFGSGIDTLVLGQFVVNK